MNHYVSCTTVCPFAIKEEHQKLHCEGIQKGSVIHLWFNTKEALTEHRKKFPIQLSGGMQQRCAVARALVSRPKVLLLDEPLGAVDFQMRELMQNELERMVREANITVVMVTHDVSESVFFSDRVIVFGREKGQIVGDIKIDLPRTRDRSSKEYEGYVFQLTNLLREAFKGAVVK